MLCRNGYEVWANYHSDDEAAASLKQEIEANGGICKLLKFDVGNPSEVKSILRKEVDALSTGIDVLVNNAGIRRDGLFVWMKESDWSDVIQTNLNSFYYVTSAVLMGMVKKKSGRIITISSAAGQSGLPGQVNYSASKAGLIGASIALAKEVARYNILVNVVAPGYIETDMTANIDQKKTLENIPLKRWGVPEDVAHIVEYLISEKASYITGQVISVNGGICP